MDSKGITCVASILILLQITPHINSTKLFDVKIDKVEVCQEETASDNARMHVAVDFAKHPKGLIIGNVTILEDDDPVGQRFEIYQWRKESNDYEDIYMFNSGNICGSTFLKENVHDLFIKLIHANNECYIKKGVSILNDVDIENIAATFLKKDILFGKYKCHLRYYSPKGTILCFNTFLNLNQVA